MSEDEDIYAEMAIHYLFSEYMTGSPLQVKHIAAELEHLGSLEALLQKMTAPNHCDSLAFSDPFSGAEELFNSDPILTEENKLIPLPKPRYK